MSPFPQQQTATETPPFGEKFGSSPDRFPALQPKAPGRVRSWDYYTGVRHDIVSMIPTEVRSVLEVGCAAGGTGQLLREKGIETLVGIDIDPYAALQPCSHYDKLIIGDAEVIDLDFLPEAGVDCILYPDVLEHFRDPWSTLERHLKHVKPGGYVISSIPNIRYYKTVQDLVIKGRWDYREAGILDMGHLRFFTFKSVCELFDGCGCEILDVRHNSRGSYLLKLLNRIVRNRLHEFLVKQFCVLARKRSGTARVNAR